MKAKEVFKENPKLDLMFETSDGQFFYSESLAKAHAKTLNDKTVTQHTRQAEQEENPEPKAGVLEIGVTKLEQVAETEPEGSPEPKAGVLEIGVTELEQVAETEPEGSPETKTNVSEVKKQTPKNKK